MIVAAIVLIVAFVGYQNMRSINEGMTTLYNDQTLPIQQLGKTDSYLYKLRGDLYKYISIPDDRAKTGKSIDQDFTMIEEQLNLYRASNMIADERVELVNFDLAWPIYRRDVRALMELANSGHGENALAQLKDGTEISNHRKAVAAAN